MSNPNDRRNLVRLPQLQSAPPEDGSGPTKDGRPQGTSAADLTPEELAAHRRERAVARALAAAKKTPTPNAEQEQEPAAKETRPRRPELRSTKPPERVVELVPLPQLGRKRSFGVLISFVVCVVLPVVAASVYYFGFASRQYVSEFNFLVQDAKTVASGTSFPGLPSMFGTSAMPANSVQNYMVAEYLLSWQAVDALQSKLDIKRLYDRPDVDWLARLAPSASIEELVSYWKRMASASYDQITGLGVARVRAFSAQDAHLVATTLVSLAEELVNRVANRPQQDAVRFAENDVKRAEDRLQAVRAELTRFRNTEQLIEPQANVVTTNVSLAQALRASLSQLETDLTVLTKEKLNADARLITTLQTRIRATREQLAVVESQVGKSRDGSTPLSKVVAEYEFLDMERQFAQNMVVAAMQNLEQARAAALSQHLYVTTFISPMLPQTPSYPKRISSILFVALGCMLFWAVALLIIGSVRERLT